MKRALSCLLIATATLCACRTKPPAPTSQGFPAKLGTNAFTSVSPLMPIQNEWLKPPVDFFRLGPGDVLEIEVIGEPVAPASVMVGPDGKIYYSLLPGLFVWGLSLSEARDLMEKNLAKELRQQPELGLTLKAVGSRRVWILGNVGAPGVYSLATPVTLLEAIAAAGGVAQQAGVGEAAEIGRAAGRG